MDIPYVSRSKFLKECERAISAGREGVENGVPLRVNLDEGGYAGRIIVTIDGSEQGVFEADWERKDPTRFPVRIRAAATALFNCSCFGRYEISHSDGSLEIRKT